MNISLPFPLLPLLCASILSATFMLGMSTFIIGVSPVLWIIPAAFIVTFAIHTTFILLSNTEDATNGSLRVFSSTILAAYSFASLLWGAAMGVIIAYTILLFNGHLPLAPSGRRWAMITAGVASLLQTSLMTTIAVQIRRVRQRLCYREKWRWRPGATSSQWSIAQT